MTKIATFWVFVAALVLIGCRSRPLDRCREIRAERLQLLPQRLSETGLYADVPTGTLAEGVRSFEPRFELWSDGATKRRWVWLPPGTQVDTSDPDVWQLPVGTKLWKEFTRDGVRVETRLLWRMGPNPEDWLPVAYVWNAEGTDAFLSVEGQSNARSTPHDVPAASQCMGCHGWHPSRALGFSAIQLARPGGPDNLDLSTLVAEGRLTHPISKRLRPPGNEVDVAALGYLHANCGPCHNPHRSAPSLRDAREARCFHPENGVDLWLASDRLESVEETSAYRTTVGTFVEPGRPEDSRLIELVSRRGGELHMPPLGTEDVDIAGLETLRAWVRGL